MNAMTNNMPQFTAGGSSEALIATPTRLDVESSSTDRATPRPEKNAIGNPVKNVTLLVRLFISGVGQSFAISVQNVVTPISIPKMIHAKMDSSSFLADLFIIGKSQMTRP
mmetsp:Transcript_28511/g.57383  ORF Transcript_28511/g.57383 Transcript_28511/m.57383 type:complete len:110 (-) Transcript_28511:585-914(-)